MNVVEYLKANGLQALVDEFKIIVQEYLDRVTLNYNQIESPRFHPICDECRGLILRKDTWEVLSRAFDRFYNVGEGESYKNIVISESVIYEKLDGSCISLYHDGEKWNVATRKMAYAEGQTTFGMTFAELFNQAKANLNIGNMMSCNEEDGFIPLDKGFTFIFELTSPANRVVTPYSETKITLIGARNKITGIEFGNEELDDLAGVMEVSRPKVYNLTSLEDIIKAANELGSMEEGFVIAQETPDGILRAKCKNGKYLAIAHLRENGGMSPKNILHLVRNNDHHEYLSYFKEDKPYFDIVEEIYNESVSRIKDIYNRCQDISLQKTFALTIMPQCVYGHEKSVLFNLRKGISLDESLNSVESKRLAESLNLKARLCEKFPNIKKFEEVENEN
jgi:hypothetical protein